MREKKKNGKKPVVLIVIASLIAVFFIVQYALCANAVKKGYERLESYNAQELELGYGNMTYADTGEGEAVLSVHGISGGYDQAVDAASYMISDCRIIAPSRFGYPGSDIPADPSPREQAKAFVELLDALGIDKVYVVGESAGGTVAIRFALDFPERTKGLILFSSAPPLTEKPDEWTEYQGPPSFLCNNFGMWLIHPFFEPIMGMDSDTIYTMLPVSERRDGMINDAAVTNPDMAANHDEYTIEDLRVPILIFQAKDDKMTKYEFMEKAVSRFPDCTFIEFETGGHLMTGHGDEIKAELEKFIIGTH
jgi:pimeloyl-ACP methyl ester carboxylesterase